MQIGAATVESSVEIPQKIKNASASWPSDLTCGNISEETQPINLKEYKQPAMFTAALFTIAKIWKQPKCSSVDEWVKQPWDVYTVEYYSSVSTKQTSK